MRVPVEKLVWTHMHASPLSPVVAALRWGLHLLAVALTVVVVMRAVLAGPGQYAAAVIACCWLAVYFAGGLLVSRRPLVWAWLGALTVLWAVDLTLFAEAVYLVFVLFFLYLHVLPRIVGSIALIASTAVAIVGFGLHNGWSAAAVIGPALGACVAAVISSGYAQLFAEAAEREQLITELRSTRADLASQQQAVGRAAERERVAAEIHDTVAQSLSSIQLLLHAAEQACGPSASPTIEMARTAAADALTETRRLIAGLSPAPLQGQSLAEALRRVASDADAHGIAVRVVIEGTPQALPMPLEAALVRIAQGAVSNVIRHARAASLFLTLTYTEGEVHLDVVDDGEGFDTMATRGYGLDTIRRRVAELGGVADLDSEPGNTVLAVTFPLFPEEAA